MFIANIIAFLILTIGGLNWGLIGIFNWNLVAAIFGGYNVGSIIIYILVLVATLWLVFSLFFSRGAIYFCKTLEEKNKNDKNSK